MTEKFKYGKLKFDSVNNEWVISELNPDAIIVLKRIFHKISQSARPPFRFSNTLDVCCDLDWFFLRYPVEMSEEVSAKLKSRVSVYRRKQDNLSKIISPKYRPIAIKLRQKAQLRDYQAQAVELLSKTKSLLLGDELGLGKTVSGIGSLVKINKLPAIIVVPPHLANHWKEKIREFTNLRIQMIEGTKPYKLLPNKDVFIIKYSCLLGWMDYFSVMDYKMVIFDEVHHLRRCETKRYEAARALVDNAEYKLGLTATPIYNRGEEIYNILDLLNEGCLGNRYDFNREWVDYDNHIKDPKALGMYLRNNFLFLRRTPEDVGRELPTINKIIQNVDFDDKVVRDHERLMKELAIKVLQGSPLQQGQASRELDMMARKITGLSKARAVAKYVKILLDNGRKVLLAGWHRDVYDIWEEELEEYNPVFYTGTENGKQKNMSAEEFKKEDSKHQVMIISLKSGEGLDGLQFVSKDVVFGELAWSPATHNQTIGRLNRDGQTEQVTAHYLVSDSGSDPLIIDLLGVKSSQSSNIVDPLKGVAKVSSDKSRFKLLAKEILDKIGKK